MMFEQRRWNVTFLNWSEDIILDEKVQRLVLSWYCKEVMKPGEGPGPGNGILTKNDKGSGVQTTLIDP